MNREPKLFIISGPSGAGKTTIAQRMLEEVEGLTRSISCTTREKRKTEIEDVDYKFINRGRFQALIEKGAFLEWAEVLGNLYGTLKKDVKASLDLGKDVLLCIDVKGAMQVLKKEPKTVAIFIMPPSVEELRSRLLKRGETGDELKKRIDLAEEEMEAASQYHHIVHNDVVHKAVNLVKSIVYAERYKNSLNS